MNLVALSNFFHLTKGEIPGYCPALDEMLRQTVQNEFLQGHFSNGYRDGVVLITLNPADFSNLKSRVVTVDEDTKFVTVCKSRVPGEKPRKKTMALAQELSPANYIKAVLYRSDVLEEDNDRSSDSEWELVTLLVQVDEFEPMATATLMANHFKADGGTATNMSPADFEQALRISYNYWKNRSLGITEYEYLVSEAEQKTQDLEYRLRNQEGMDID